MNAPRGLTAAVLVLACLVFIWHARAYRDWVEDDAYISFRYARNLADGEGLVYNPGEKVEGYSNFAWVLLAAAVLGAGGEPLPVAQGIAVLSGLICLLAAWRLARLLAPDHPRAALLAPWLLALTPVLTRHATSGLETDAFAAAVAVALLLALEPDGRRVWRWLLVAILVLAALLRPEGTAVALLMLAVAWRGGRVGRVEALAVLTLVAVFHVWRVIYFGELMPNTYHAKLTGGLAALRPGLHHALDFLRENGGVSVVGFTGALFLIRGSRRTLPALLATLAVVALQAAVVIAAGGDWMHHYRLLAPVLPLLAATTAAGAGVTFAAVGRATGRPLRTGLVVLAVLLLALANAVMIEREVAREVLPSLQADGYLTQSYRRLGLWLRANTPDDTVVAASDIGAVGWYSERRILDMFGLVDKHIARQPGILHGKFDADHVLARRPDLVVLVEKRRADGTVFHRRLSDQALAERPAFAAAYEVVHEEPIMYMGEKAVVYARRAE